MHLTYMLVCTTPTHWFGVGANGRRSLHQEQRENSELMRREEQHKKTKQHESDDSSLGAFFSDTAKSGVSATDQGALHTLRSGATYSFAGPGRPVVVL